MSMGGAYGAHEFARMGSISSSVVTWRKMGAPRPNLEPRGMGAGAGIDGDWSPRVWRFEVRCRFGANSDLHVEPSSADNDAGGLGPDIGNYAGRARYPYERGAASKPSHRVV